jgi:hypothetical protein
MAMGAYHGVAALLSPQRGARVPPSLLPRSIPAQYPAQRCRWQVAARNGFVTFRPSTLSDVSNKEPQFSILGYSDCWDARPVESPSLDLRPEHARCGSQREKRHPRILPLSCVPATVLVQAAGVRARLTSNCPSGMKSETRSCGNRAQESDPVYYPF